MKTSPARRTTAPAWPAGWPAALLAAALLAPATASSQALSLDAARRGVEAVAPAGRLAAVERLGEVGAMADAPRLVARLADDDADIRAAATASMWQIWGRSGDAAIDTLYRRGLAEMQAGRLEDALLTYSEIIRRKPAFAEGWNKRATVHYLLGRFGESLKDCDEVLKRNPIHFGALSGYAQIHIALGDPERALAYYQRALAINPYLPNGDEAVRALEERIAARRRSTT